MAIETDAETLLGGAAKTAEETKTAEEAKTVEAAEKAAAEKAAEGKTVEEIAAEKAATEKAAAEKKEPEFKLALPKDSPLPVEFVEGAIEFAKEHKLSPEVAQAILEDQSDLITEVLAAEQEEFGELKATWKKQVVEDKTFGGAKLAVTLAAANRAIDKFGSPELNVILKESGFGNRLEFVGLLARVGAAMKEDTLENSTDTPSTEKTAEQMLYGGK